MARIAYDVPVIRQMQNPICWVASAAMVKSYKTGASVSIGSLLGGFDPSSASIDNPGGGAPPTVATFLRSWGFTVDSPAMTASASYIEGSLRDHGPLVLIHYCLGFPYGSRWGSATFTAANMHAVVLTGIDTDANIVTFNNPWGDKDQPAGTALIVAAINKALPGPTLAYM